MRPTLQEKGTGLWGLELPGEGRAGSGPAAPAAAGDSRSSPAARHSAAAVAALHTASTAAHLAAHTARHRGNINLERTILLINSMCKRVRNDHRLLCCANSIVVSYAEGENALLKS